MPISKINNLSIADGAIAINDFSATGTPSASTFLRGDNSWASAGGNNTPYFLAQSGTGTVADATWTKINFENEVVDTNNCYNTSTHRFTPTSAGYYFVYIKMLFYANPGSDDMRSGMVAVYKNGSNAIGNGNNGYYRNGAGLYYFMQPQFSTYVYLNGTTDYIEAWGYMQSSSGRNYDGSGCYFMAHKLIA
jgi:hypothetical protein